MLDVAVALSRPQLESVKSSVAQYYIQIACPRMSRMRLTIAGPIVTILSNVSSEASARSPIDFFRNNVSLPLNGRLPAHRGIIGRLRLYLSHDK